MIASDMTNPNNANPQIFHRLKAVNARKIRGQTADESDAPNKSYLFSAINYSHYTQLARNQS
jgi:hypothetical protein